MTHVTAKQSRQHHSGWRQPSQIDALPVTAAAAAAVVTLHIDRTIYQPHSHVLYHSTSCPNSVARPQSRTVRQGNCCSAGHYSRQKGMCRCRKNCRRVEAVALRQSSTAKLRRRDKLFLPIGEGDVNPSNQHGALRAKSATAADILQCRTEYRVAT